LRQYIKQLPLRTSSYELREPLGLPVPPAIRAGLDVEAFAPDTQDRTDGVESERRFLVLLNAAIVLGDIMVVSNMVTSPDVLTARLIRLTLFGLHYGGDVAIYSSVPLNMSDKYLTGHTDQVLKIEALQFVG
jgi:hypothetical protein